MQTIFTSPGLLNPPLTRPRRCVRTGPVPGRLTRRRRRDPMVGRQLVRRRVPARHAARPRAVRVRGGRATAARRPVDPRQEARDRRDGLRRGRRRVGLRGRLGGRAAARTRGREMAGRHATRRLLGGRSAARPRPHGVAGRRREWRRRARGGQILFVCFVPRPSACFEMVAARSACLIWRPRLDGKWGIRK